MKQANFRRQRLYVVVLLIIMGLFVLTPITVSAQVSADFSQDFNALSSASTTTTDSVTSGSPLSNAGSQNFGGAGLDFVSVWVDTRSTGAGPVTPSGDTSDFIGVNSFAGSNAPDVAADGTPVSSGSEHNFEFNDTDGRIDLVFAAVDLSTLSNPVLSFDYWINNTGYESDDAFFVTINDGTIDQTYLNYGESELEANASPDDGTANWQNFSISLDGFDITQINLIISVDTNSSDENLYVDNVEFKSAPVLTQDFNALSASGTTTTDSVASGAPLTNAGSQNLGGAGLDFMTFWFDTRSVGSGPVTPSGDTSDFIGVNSFAGSGAPNVAADGTPVANGAEHNFEFNDTDGRIDLVFEAVDISSADEPVVRFDYWIATTGYEADDAFYATISDGSTSQTYLNYGEPELEANASADDSTANWHTLEIDLSSFDTTQIVLTISVDNNSADENIFVDNIEFADGLTDPDPDPDPELTLIHAIQGNGTVSPLLNTVVIIEGVVVGDFQNNDADTSRNLGGFYVQEETVEYDADPATSEGIFVFQGSLNVDVEVGQIVSVTGTVQEYFGETQVADVTDITIVNPVPSTTATAPATVSLPLPTTVNSDGNLIADLEAYEGMLVTFPQILSVTELFNLDRFGELRVSQGGRLYQYTNFAEPDVAGYASHLVDIASRNLMIDDGQSIQNPDPLALPTSLDLATDSFRMGDVLSDLTGVVRFSRGSGSFGDEIYRIMPMSADYTRINVRPTSAPSVGGNITVASFNVLNFFTTLDNSGSICGPNQDVDCRGADTQAEFDRQLDKTVSALVALDADIVGLIELENNAFAAPANDGIDPVLETLVNELNANTARNYTFVDAGIVGTDAIKVAFIYDANTIGIADATSVAILTDSELAGLGLAGLAPVFDGVNTSRAPLAVTFEELSTGGTFTTVINHFKSKSGEGTGADADQLNGAGAWNQRRTNAATVVNAWLATDPTGSGDDDFLLIGDFNAYLQEDPIDTLELNFDNLLETFVVSSPYSYVFDGQAGALDSGFSSSTLTSQVTGIAEWHINSDEADLIDYNLDFGAGVRELVFRGDLPFRASDHDPFVIGLTLAADSPPTAELVNLSHDPLFAGETATLGFTNISDPDDPELDDFYTYAIDCESDGVIDNMTYGGVVVISLSCEYTGAGMFDVSGFVRDDTGLIGNTNVVTINLISTPDAFAFVNQQIGNLNSVGFARKRIMQASLDAALRQYYLGRSHLSRIQLNALYVYIQSLARRDHISEEERMLISDYVVRLISSVSAN